jgi:hypothetical protein
MKIVTFSASLLILVVLTGFSFRLEKDYQRAWARDNAGVCEVRTADGARVDIVTDTYAVEVDFAKKWAESLGQCLLYSACTGKKPAVLLICGPKDTVYRNRLLKAIEYHKLPVTVFYVDR